MALSDKELLSRLVGFDSTSTNSNLPIADFICEYLDGPGVEIVRVPSEDERKVNVVALIGPLDAEEAYEELAPGTGGGGLVLSGHLDVVPADEDGWRSNPFTLTKVQDTYVGRGACDMKGSVALAMNVFTSVDADELEFPLVLAFTYDEELGSLGAQRLVETWPEERLLPRNVVVGEPTSLRAVRMHKGHLTMRVTVEGRAAHSGSPQIGVNAIEAAARAVQGIMRLADPLKRQRCEASRFFSAVPFPVINVARISGGTAINVVPDHCVVDLGVRLLPGMNVEAMIEQVRDTVAKSDPHGKIEVEVVNNSPPMLLEERADVYVALRTLLGQKQCYGVSYASDAGILQGMSLQCVLFGPGSIDVAHRPNEFVPIEELERARPILEGVVEHFCMP